MERIVAHLPSEIDKIMLLIREGEGLSLEFKERYSPRIDEDIVAFSNARGGTLLIGVRDDNTIVGEHLNNDLKARINSLARNCNPSVAVEIKQVGQVVVITVPEGMDKPYACGSGYYRRLNGSTQKMSHTELRAMFTENEPIPFEERAAKGFSFEDISRAKIRAFTKEAGIRIGNTSAANFLRSLGTANKTQVNNAGVLFFGTNVHEHIHQAQLTLLAFKGTGKSHIYDRRDVRDDLLTQFNEAMAFIRKHLNIRSEIEGVNRYDIYEIPIEVIREAVVNALMHRDYSVPGTQASLEIYDDRVEIRNPGGLPRGMSTHRLGSVSVRRNEIVSDLFFRLHKVERIGMGINKMKEGMAAAGLRPPEFTPDDFFTALFFRSTDFALKSKETLAASPVTPGQNEGSEKSSEKSSEKLLKFLARNSTASAREAAAALGLSTRSIEKHLASLKTIGKLKRIGPDKGGRWLVVRSLTDAN